MAATIANAIPQPLKDVFDQAYKFTKGYVKTAHTMFKNYENRAVVALKVNLHPSTHSAAEKIARSVPETLATLSMLTSFSPLRFLAGAFLAAKAIYTVSPAVKSAFKGDVNGDDWEAAKTETKKTCRRCYRQICSCCMHCFCSSRRGYWCLRPPYT